MKKHLIIGGGFSGLSAAYDLAKLGHSVAVVESGRELGGLAASFEIEGEAMEKAYHHIFRTDTDILNLIKEIGADDILEWHESSVAIYRAGKIWPFMTPMDLLRFGPVSLIGRIRLGFTALILQKTKNWRKYSSKTALEWMTKMCGRSAVAAVWGPLLKGKFSRYYDKISMAWLWARLHVRANSRDPGETKEKLGYIKGGFAALIGRLEGKLLEQGVEIHKETRVEALSEADDGTLRVRFNESDHCFDRVLFTGSNNAFSKVFPNNPQFESYHEDLGQISYLGAMCCIFTTQQKLGDHYWVNINEEDAPFLVFIRHTALVPASRYGDKEVYYIGAYCPQEDGIMHQTQEEIQEIWFNYLKKVYPHFDPSVIESTSLFRFRDAQHIVEPGYEEKIQSYRTPIQSVYLANFTQIYPEDRGTNFAVREGRKVALEMLK